MFDKAFGACFYVDSIIYLFFVFVLLFTLLSIALYS